MNKAISCFTTRFLSAIIATCFLGGLYGSGVARADDDVLLPASVLLPIPNRLQDPAAPPEGWCGEATIQMGMAYYKKEVSQKVIHSAGKPRYPDLRSNEIDTALEALGVQYLSWRSGDLPQFLTWIKTNLAKGYPVFCGVKINPTRHPDWFLDHFVLAVGYNEKGLYINTNHSDGQILIEYPQLSSLINRYSFENQYHFYFGRAFTGVKEKPIPKLKSIFVDSSKLKRLAGRYKFGVLTRTITFDGKNLYDQSEGGSKRMLIPLSETEFDYDDYEDVVIRLRFELSGDKVTGVHHRVASDVSEEPLQKRMEPIEDKDPKVTALVQQCLREAIEGTLKPDVFTPNLAAKIFPDQVREAGAFFKSLGPQTGIDLYEQEEMGSIRQYLYRVSFGENHVILRLSLMEDNRIFKIDFYME